MTSDLRKTYRKIKLVTAGQMQELDSAAINQYKIASLELMENAGRGTVDTLLDHLLDKPQGREAAVFVGPGNNGGDGLVIARLLAAKMALPTVYLLVPANKLKGDSAVNLTRLQEFPVKIVELKSEKDLQRIRAGLENCWIIIDAIFGTGLTREVSGIFAAAVNLINESSCTVVAVDIASGLDSDSGRPLGICVQADITVTFGQAKIGHVIHPGSDFTGFLKVVDIGIPEGAVEQADIRLELLTDDVGFWLPPRTPLVHKGNYGHLLIMAGSTGKTGAGLLCGLGALRSGTGLVSLCVPYDLNPVYEANLWEAMTIPLKSAARGFLSIDDYRVIQDALHAKQAVALGPGIGTAPETAELIFRLYTETDIPMLIDADALNILAAAPERLKKSEGPRILTPHPGEMARLTGKTSAEIQHNRFEIAKEFSVAHKVYLVLKGADTLVCDPDGNLAVNPTGNPGMACGGMGDVLSGIIGGFLAQGVSPWEACCLGVYSHGMSADRLADDVAAGYLASEVAHELPYVLEDLRKH